MPAEQAAIPEVFDSDLMMRLASGDDFALNALIDLWSQRLAAFLYKMTGQRDAALDLAQETFVKLYQARERYRPGGNFSTYLFTIASNLARNHTRWKGRHPTVSIDATDEDCRTILPEAVDPNGNPEEAAEAGEKFRAIHDAFISLPPDLREAMTLFVYEGMGYAEIATVCQCSVKAVETRIYRARQLLKEQLKDLRS
jgi:RNA polymerase sigma-70 factor (ECF subfamily)